MHPVKCSKCGYDLAGLPGAGNCPECGQRFWVTRGKGIVKRETAESKGSRILRRARTIVLGVLGLLLVTLGIMLHMIWKRPNALASGLGLGVMFILGAAISWGLEKDDAE